MLTRPSLWSFGPALARGLFALALAVLLGIGALSYGAISRHIETSAWIANSHERISHINAVQAQMALAAASQRGYALTREPHNQAQSRVAANEARAALGELRAVARDSPEHAGNLERLTSVVQRALAHFERAIEQERPAPPDPRLEIETVRAGTHAMDELATVLRDMRVAERALFNARQRDLIDSARRSRAVVIAGTAASALLFGAFSIVVAVQARQRALLEAQREKIFHVSRDLLCEVGIDGRFKRVNPAWQRVLGWTPEELMARPYLEFVHPDDRERTLAQATAIESGRDAGSFENRYVCKDGAYRWLSWVATGLAPGDNLIYASARDVTERRSSDEAIRALNEELGRKHAAAVAANQELDAFSYSVSHDLRAPLRAIDGFSRIVVEDYGDKLDDEGRRLLQVVRENTARMGRLIDDLLNFSRAGRKSMQAARIDMTALVRSVYEELERSADGRRIVFELGELPDGWGDPAMVRQVWVNLLSNAVKYTRGRDPATIRVQGERTEEAAIYSVRDDGAGFDMRYADKLFGVFQRLHAASEFEGTGVGLALVQRVVLRHGGRVWAEGKVGEGATFSFALPGEDTNDG